MTAPDIATLVSPDPRPGDRPDELITPALVVDPARLDRNIAAAQQTMADLGVSLRPHWKTSKCLQVARRQRAAGAIGFTCATSREAATLLAEPDLGTILWAHQPVGPAKTRFAARAARTGRLLVGVDSEAGARALSSAAQAEDTEIAYLLEIDTGSGRAGVLPEAAVELRQRLESLSGLRFRGVFTFEGAGLSGRTPDQLGAIARRSGEAVITAAAALADAGSACEVISVGSTPGMHDTPTIAGVTEARPGTYVYYDRGQIGYAKATVDECALTVLARVISTPRADQVIIDAGTKSMSSDRFGASRDLGIPCDLDVRPLPDLAFTNANEEHGWLTGPGAAALAVGDLVRIVPNHACTATNSWGRLVVVEPGTDTVADVWPILARY